MSKKDFLQRFIFANMPIRGEFIQLQTSYQTIINQHKYPPAIQQLLGEALSVAALLCAIIKFEGRLTVQFRGKGELSLLIAQCDNNFRLRGLVKWEGDLSYDDLMTAFNDGVLMIMLDSHPGKNQKGSHYQGVVAWRGNSLAESIEGYFRDSEQLATKLWLCVNDSTVAGLLLQVIPASDKNQSTLEKESENPDWEHVVHQTSQVDCNTLLHLDFEDLLNKLYSEDEIRIFPPVDIAFGCTCSRHKGEEAILLLGYEEAKAELRSKKNIVVTCDFCNKDYVFDHAEVEKLFHDNDKPPSEKQLH